MNYADGQVERLHLMYKQDKWKISVWKMNSFLINYANRFHLFRGLHQQTKETNERVLMHYCLQTVDKESDKQITDQFSFTSFILWVPFENIWPLVRLSSLSKIKDTKCTEEYTEEGKKHFFFAVRCYMIASSLVQSDLYPLHSLLHIWFI